MEPSKIRRFEPRDAPVLAAIFFDAVRNGALGDYSEAQVTAWAPVVPPPEGFVARARDGRAIFVAVDDLDQPVAYGDLETSGHIDHLYCRSAWIGTGLASALYDELECEARKARLDKLFVEASEAARRLFLSKGFVVTERRDFHLRGTLIHNYLMEKTL